MQRHETCCFTGHRSGKLPWKNNENDPRCLALKEELDARLEGIYLSGYRHFICGMALGCDMYFAEAVLKLRERHGDVSLEAAIPCADQPENWAREHRLRYNRLIDACDKVTVLQIKYSPDCMMKRNRYMVDRSSLVLACFNGSSGGTMNTLLYAQRSGAKTLVIDIDKYIDIE